jgi:hypothetical protein
MFQLARLSQWPRRPSELLNLSGEGYSPEQCLDYDFAVGDYWDWLKAKQDEQKPVREQRELPRGYAWGPKYDTMEQIFDLFDRPAQSFCMDEAVRDFDLDAFYDSWGDTDAMRDWEGADDDFEYE